VRFTLDTNVLVYAAVQQSGPKHRAAIDIVERARSRDCVVALQALAELFRVLTGKFKATPAHAAAVVHKFRTTIPVVIADEDCLIEAMDAVVGHSLSFWDAMLWATAKRAGCRLLLSEDGDDGRTLGGVTLVNPFDSPRAPLLVQALGGRRSR
jgi:predicted nucleic acid-binding protein